MDSYLAVVAGLTALHAFFGRKRGLVGVHKLELLADGLRESTDVNTAFVRWNSGMKIRLTRRYALVWVHDNGIHIIPRLRSPRHGNVEDFLCDLKSAMTTRVNETD